MHFSKWIPGLEWLRTYQKQQFKGDLSAGLTVGVMLIPQGMAYAMIAGLPPIYGLYASTLPLLIYGIMGTSRQLAVGPVAMVSLLTAAGIGAIAETGTETYILFAITLAFMVGLIQFLLGVFRLGFMVNFLSHPVVSGFTSAAALIIGLSQLKHLLGVPIPKTNYVHEILAAAFQQINQIHWTTFFIGLAGIGAILFIRKINRALPGQLLAVILGILLVWGFGLADAGVKIVGEVPSGFPGFSRPSLHPQTLQTLLPIALTISLVGFMESIAVAKAIQSKHKNYKVVPNKELVALGMANIGGSFFNAFPVTGGFSRTAVNDQAGAQTGMASIFSAVLIVLTLLFLTPLFYFLPNAILAAVIMVAVFGLIDYKEATFLWKKNREDFWMLAATFAATLGLGIEEGIGIGVVLSLAMVLFRSTRPHIAVLGKVPGTTYYRNVERFGEVEQRPDLLILRFDADLYFANVNFFQDTLDELIHRKGPALKGIVFNAESISRLDSSAAHTLEEFLDSVEKSEIKVLFTGVKGPVRDTLQKYQLIEKIGKDHFFVTQQEAVDFFDGKTTKNQTRKLVLQTNE